jgi:hypothetical protein
MPRVRLVIQDKRVVPQHIPIAQNFYLVTAGGMNTMFKEIAMVDVLPIVMAMAYVIIP